MVVSETYIGGLIGRCGFDISRIRIEYGAIIKVYGGKGEQNVRHIQFSGSSQQVALAKQRVDECIYSHVIQQADTQPSGNRNHFLFLFMAFAWFLALGISGAQYFLKKKRSRPLSPV